MPKKVLTTPDPPATLTAPVDEVQLSRLISKRIKQRDRVPQTVSRERLSGDILNTKRF